MKTMSAEVCRFIRKKGDKAERGIAINDGAGNYDVKVIIDMNFKVVPTPLEQYSLHTEEGCFQFLADIR